MLPQKVLKIRYPRLAKVDMKNATNFNLQDFERPFKLNQLVLALQFSFNDDSDEVGEILGVLLEKNVIPKILNYVETVIPSLPAVFIQTGG